MMVEARGNVQREREMTEKPFQHCIGLGGTHKFGDMRLVKETNARLDFEATCEVCGYVGQWYTANYARQVAGLARQDWTR
jgi:hypothetical protein